MSIKPVASTLIERVPHLNLSKSELIDPQVSKSSFVSFHVRYAAHCPLEIRDRKASPHSLTYLLPLEASALPSTDGLSIWLEFIASELRRHLHTAAAGPSLNGGQVPGAVAGGRY